MSLIKISKAKIKDTLNSEWIKFTHEHYGKDTEWFEKSFRFKATENKLVVGTIDCKIEPGVLYISALMVKECYRGKGIGKLLINKAEEHAKKYGVHRSWLFTGEDWENRSFYEKIGFKYIATFPDFYFHKTFVAYTRLIK